VRARCSRKTSALLLRAKVPYRDLYSLRWTFVSLARSSGEVPFNVSRVIDHARGTIVDTIYVHTVDSGVAGVSGSVAQRAGLTVCPTGEPTKPTAPSGRRTLRVIDGGRRAARSENQRDIRKTIENVPDGASKEGTSA